MISHRVSGALIRICGDFRVFSEMPMETYQSVSGGSRRFHGNSGFHGVFESNSGGFREFHWVRRVLGCLGCLGCFKGPKRIQASLS